MRFPKFLRKSENRLIIIIIIIIINLFKVDDKINLQAVNLLF